MPDPTTVSTPETVQNPLTPATPVTVVEEPTQSTPQLTAREELYQRYYQSQAPAQPQQVPEGSDGTGGGEVVQDPTANVEPTEPTPTQPQAPQPDAQAILIESLQAQLKAMEARLPAPTPPVAPVVVEEIDATTQFLTLLQAGKPQEAVNILKNAIRQEVEKDVAEKFVPEAQTRAVEQVWLEGQIDNFVNTLRVQNPDLIPLEEFISVKAQAKIEAAQKANKIQSSKDFLAIYKQSVNEATEETRKVVQQIRGAGRQDALTTQQRVLSSQPVPPNPVTNNRPDSTPVSNEPPVGSTEAYLAKRKELMWQRKGLNA